MHAELLPGAALAGLAAEVEALGARAFPPNPFLAPAFLGPALAHLPGGGNVRLACARRADGGLSGFLPVVPAPRRWGAGPALAMAWTHPYAVLGSPLLARGERAAAFGALCEALGELGGAPRLLLLPSAPVEDELLADRRHAVFRAHARARLESAGGGEATLAHALSAKKRKEYARQSRRLGDGTELFFRVEAAPAALREGAEAFLALEAAGWKGRRGTALAGLPAEAAFFRAALQGLAETGACRLAILERGGAPVAMGVVFLAGGEAFFWKIAYDEAHARHSPGVLLTLALTRHLIDVEGVRLADSCAQPGHPMIDHVWRGRRPLADLLIEARPSGPRFALAAALEGARVMAGDLARGALRRIRPAP